MYEEKLRNLQSDLNWKDKKISQLEKEQKQLYKKYKSLKGKSKGNFNDRLLRPRDVHFDPHFIGRDSGNMELEFKEFENQTDDSLMSEAEKVKLEVLQTS